MHIIEYLRSVQARNKAEFRSNLLNNCIEGIDGAIWLIGGFRIPQALTALYNSIELAFKGELEEIHPILIADTRNLSYDTLKSIMKDEFEQHPLGSRLNISEFDIERTITFDDAMKRVSELHSDIITKWRQKLALLKTHRNQIVHYGAKDEQWGLYTHLIATVALPFLAEYLAESVGLSLETIITPGIFKEVKVAEAVCAKRAAEGKEPRLYCLGTLSVKVRYTFIDWPRYADVAGVNMGEESFLLSNLLKKEINKEWGHGEWIKTFCEICGCPDAFVKVKPITTPTKRLLPVAIRCPKCALGITEKDEFLAEYHVGELDSNIEREYFEGLD